MSKNRYPINKIRTDYTYTVDDVAELFNITSATVFRWVGQQGLIHFEVSKKYFIHSFDLKVFIRKLNDKNKKPTPDNMIYCFKCRQPKKLHEKTLKVQKQANGSYRVLAKCVACETKMNKLISRVKWTKTHPFYKLLNASTIAPNGKTYTPSKCKVHQQEQLCLKLT